MRRVAACVSAAPIGAAVLKPGSLAVSFLPFGRVVSVRLGGTSSRLGFRPKLEYEVISEAGRFRSRLAGYSFRVLEPDEREILAFHWHPVGTSPVRHPHLHISSRMPEIQLAENRFLALARMHIPTGFVTFSDVVRLLIEEFGVEPLRHDWQIVLDTPPSEGDGACD